MSEWKYKAGLWTTFSFGDVDTRPLAQIFVRLHEEQNVRYETSFGLTMCKKQMKALVTDFDTKEHSKRGSRHM